MATAAPTPAGSGACGTGAVALRLRQSLQAAEQIPVDERQHLLAAAGHNDQVLVEQPLA
jgi:ubiquinone/menaquinone biosynthesis C-methylase UbiE